MIVLTAGDLLPPLMSLIIPTVGLIWATDFLRTVTR